MKVAIISDGTPCGTELRRVDSGELLHGVWSITWMIDNGGPARAEVQLQMVAIHGVAETCVVGPSGKYVRRIEYADGTVDEFPAGA